MKRENDGSTEIPDAEPTDTAEDIVLDEPRNFKRALTPEEALRGIEPKLAEIQRRRMRREKRQQRLEKVLPALLFAAAIAATALVIFLLIRR